LALESGDLILEQQFALLEALHLQLVDSEIHAQPGNDVIEITMLDAQLPQALYVLEQIGIDVAFVVAHGVAAFFDSVGLIL
jgi:hypothetical protein